MSEFHIQIADDKHIQYIDEILKTIEISSKSRGTGIAKRSPEYLKDKIKEKKAIIALKEDIFAGFCYIESWGHKEYVATSGLIVKDEFRGSGLAMQIKKFSLALCRQKFPNAKVFGLTSGGAVMKLNTKLGYFPVPFSQLTDDDNFWKGCQGCSNYDILTRTERKYCICTAFLYDPKKIEDSIEIKDLINKINEE